jgi:hypothetical protein
MKFLEQVVEDFPHHLPLTYSDFGYTNPLFIPPQVDSRLKLPPCLDQEKIGVSSIFCSLVYDHTTNKINEEIKTMEEGVRAICDQNNKPMYAFQIYPEIYSMKASISKGFPISLSISLFESFSNDFVSQTGVVCMPLDDEKCIGNHAVLLCGYSDTHKFWIVRNSFGPHWGQSGYFTIPYEYKKYFSSNMWIVASPNSVERLPKEKQVKMDKNAATNTFVVDSYNSYQSSFDTVCPIKYG